MAATTSTREHPVESTAHPGEAEGEPGAENDHWAGMGSVDATERRANDAVALAFTTIVSRRYPGTSWLPVKRSGSNDGFVVPTRKVVRLLPGPTNVHAKTGVGHPAASAADRRASHEHRANPCA